MSWHRVGRNGLNQGYSLPPINAPLDEKIASLVMALRADGFPTFASCEGHVTIGGAEQGQPWVNVTQGSWAGSRRIAQTRRRLIDWLQKRDVMANVVQVYSTIEGEDAFPFIRIEIYSPLAEAKL